MVPHYLRQILPDAKIGMSIYANFPCYENLASIYGMGYRLHLSLFHVKLIIL